MYFVGKRKFLFCWDGKKPFTGGHAVHCAYEKCRAGKIPALHGRIESDADQFVAVFAQADLLGVLDLRSPGSVGEVAGQVVQVGTVGLCQKGHLLN